MADQTIAGNAITKKIVAKGRKDLVDFYSDILVTNGVDMRAGMFITREGETSPDIDLIASGEAAYGIILDYANVRDYPAGYTRGHTFPDNSKVKVLRRVGGVQVQTILWRDASSSLAVALGDPAYVIDGGTWDVVGVSRLSIGHVTGATPTTAARRDRLYVGRFAKAHAVDSAENLVTLVDLEG